MAEWSGFRFDTDPGVNPSGNEMISQMHGTPDLDIYTTMRYQNCVMEVFRIIMFKEWLLLDK